MVYVIGAELFEMVRLRYGQATYLFFRLDTPASPPALSTGANGALHDLLSRYRWIRCVRGVHQGCPFGSLLFCLALVSVVEAVLRQFPSVRIPSIADDMALVGPQLDCAVAFIELKRRLWEDLRLKVAPGKCKAFSCGGHIHPEVRSILEGEGCHVVSSSTFHGSMPKLTSSEEQSDYLKKEHTSLFERSTEQKIDLRMKILGNFRAQVVRVF